MRVLALLPRARYLQVYLLVAQHSSPWRTTTWYTSTRAHAHTMRTRACSAIICVYKYRYANRTERETLILFGIIINSRPARTVFNHYARYRRPGGVVVYNRYTDTADTSRRRRKSYARILVRQKKKNRKKKKNKNHHQSKH